MKLNFKNILLVFLIPIFLGIITSISLPPYNTIYINFITFPILLFLIIRINKESKIFSFIIGWVFGFGYFISNIYWISNALKFEEIFKPLIPITIVAIPIFLGLFYGLATFAISFFKLKKNLSTIILFSISFAIVEYFRGFIFGGFPWNLISYSWSNYINSIQLLSVIGTFSFNLLSLTFFTFPLVLFFNKSIKFKTIFFLSLIVCLIINNLYGMLSIREFSKNKINKLDFTIKIINPTIKIDRFFNIEDSEQIIKELISMSKPSLKKKSLYIYPEGVFSHIYFDDLKYYKDLFIKNYSSEDIIIIGMNTQKKNNNESKVFNSMIVVDNNLNLISKYDKIKLVPFGEFLPFENFFMKFGLKKITYGYKSFSKGNKRKIIDLENFNISFIPLICYEIIYSGNIKFEKNNYNFIINISEDGWFGETIGQNQHFSHSLFRAIEEGKNLLRSSNNGISAYINPIGIVVKQIKSTEKGVITIEEIYKTKKTIFSKYGNKIFLYFIIIYIILFFFIKKKEKRSNNEKRFFIH